MALTTHLHVRPRSRVSGAIPLNPYVPSRHGQGRIYLPYRGVKLCVFRFRNLLILSETIISLPVEGLSFGTFNKKPDETHCSNFLCIYYCQLFVLLQDYGRGTEVIPAKCLKIASLGDG